MFLFYLFSIWTLVGQSANFDTSIKINTIVDTTQVKIGEEILYTIEIKSDNNYNIRFDEKPNFIPFEILKTYQTDTLNNSSSFKKEYSLINFEPGEYWIPRQKIYFNQTLKFSDSLLIIVNDVEVDTLKQNLYDIKPIIPVKRNYQKLFYRIIFITVLLALIYLFYKRNPLKSSKEKEELKSLYEIANEKLRGLNNLHPNSQIEFKEYYTILIDIFREYLEYQVNIPAMESTSNELISRINLLKDSGNYNFEKSDINKLENLFTKSDLIKFAKSLPSKKDIYNDVDTISKFIENIEKIYNDKFDEDEKIIKPTVKYLQKKNININGPLSADTIFVKKNRANYDVIIGMYHDQVLTPIKTIYEYDAINITLGLPFLRVSPDHGPNENMIGLNLSNPLSLKRALEFLDDK